MAATTQSDEATRPGPARQLSRAVVLDLARRRGWTTAEEIASNLGIDRATYFRLLSGANQPMYDTVLRISEAAGLPIDKLFPPSEAA